MEGPDPSDGQPTTRLDRAGDAPAVTPPSKCPRCGARLAEGLSACSACLLGASSPEDTFAGFVIEEELGRGGMGTVFRARHQKLGRDVAVKFLAPEVARDAEVLGRFEREAHALALLDHPGIVRVYDFGVEDGESYLVMELVAGGPVSDRLPLPAPEAVRVTRAVCEALRYAHDRGVIHRDVKPANVLIAADGQVKLGDFGIARVLRPDGSSWTVTKPDVAIGSVGFVAPEVLAGAPPGPRMDVYSTGALLRSLLTGRPPVGELGRLPLGLDRVVRRAMAEQPGDRFASMDELLAALAESTREHALPVDEELWMRAVAFVQTIAVAAVLWAGLLSVTPRVLEKNDYLPMTAYGVAPLSERQVLTQARFETGAILTALGMVAIALAATALLRRHWRIEGLDQPAPEPRIDTSWLVLGLGVFTLLSYFLRLWAVSKGYVLASGAGPSWLSYLPFFGGILELAVLYGTVLSVLEATRRKRPLAREPWLWVGQGVALLPPLYEFFRTL